jgi:hypothetical protein
VAFDVASGRLDGQSQLDDTGAMTDDALWVAVLTGGTAVLASWVTSRGNARAVRIQAEASAQTQRQSRSRETRCTAYLEFIEQAHITGELYWRLGDVYAQLTDPGEQLDRIQRLRADLRGAFDPLSRCARVIILEGPAPVVEAAEAVRQAAADANHFLWEISRAENGARAIRRGVLDLPRPAKQIRGGCPGSHGRA